MKTWTDESIDIVQRLKNAAHYRRQIGNELDAKTYMEAAKEIERLRREAGAVSASASDQAGGE